MKILLFFLALLLPFSVNACLNISKSSFTPLAHDYFFKNLAIEAAERKKVNPIEEIFFSLTDTDGKIAGGIYGFYFYGSALIDIIFIDKKYRNKGYGRILMEKFEEYAKQKGAKFSVVTSMDWWNAVPFYQSLGYKIEEVREGYENGSKQITLIKHFI